MSSSPNLDKTPLSVQHEEHIFEKYGLTFTMGIITEVRPKWHKVYRDPEGNAVPDDKLKEVADSIPADSGKRMSVEWEKASDTIACKYVDYAKALDSETGDTHSICLYALSDGPVLAMQEASTVENYVLLDPCIVLFAEGKISLKPLFNVARRLTIPKSAVRNKQHPGEMLVALYPGFVIQNRMMQYQLRPMTSFASSPELGNLASE